MNLNPNMLKMMQMMMSGGNPQQAVINMLQQYSNSNPMINNILQMAQSGNTQGIEQMARNMLKEKGLDFDKEFNNFRNQMKF